MQAAAVDTARLAPREAVGVQLYRLLREQVLRGDVTPGTRLSESEIATRYAVSRQPVREAFIKLAEEGLLDVRPQRGSFVRRIAVPAVLSARFVREAIEADIVRIVAAAPTPATVAALEANVAAQHGVVTDPDPSQFIVLDDAFHQLLADAAGQGGAWALIDGLKIQMTRVRYLGAQRFPRGKLVRQHEAVIAAIAARDPDAAEAALRLHLREILNDLPAIAAAQPAFFGPGVHADTRQNT